MNKKLKLWDATMLVMGSMIGSGIFIVSSDMMRNLVYTPLNNETMTGSGSFADQTH